MTNQAQNPNRKKYDLVERTAKFGEAIIKFAKKTPNTAINRPLVSQNIRAGTSVGANYLESGRAKSKKIFDTRYQSDKKNRKRQLIGAEWLLGLIQIAPMGVESFGKKLTS